MKSKIQLLLAVSLVIFGVLMITAAFIVPPIGVIDPTVLTAFGEILTFAGAIIGIDYRHRVYPPNRRSNPPTDDYDDSDNNAFGS